MELKQIEYFLACVEYKSLGKAAEQLYTSQPNVSKVIRLLEEELGLPLFERTSKGLKLTAYGKNVYMYAVNIVQNTNLIKAVKPHKNAEKFYISTYQSNSISRLLVQLYRKHSDLVIEHRQGTVGEIVEQIEQGISELGVLYISEKYATAFMNLTHRKKLKFIPMAKLKACVYAGPNSPVYQRNEIGFEELTELKYVRGLSDYFALEDGLEHLSLGLIRPESMAPAVFTNSEHFATNLLLETDLVDIGIQLDHPDGRQYDIKNIAIKGEEANLILGYIAKKEYCLPSVAQEFIESLKVLLKP